MKLRSIRTQQRICWGWGRARRVAQFYYNMCFDKSDFSQDMPQEHHNSVARLKNTAPLNSITMLDLSDWTCMIKITLKLYLFTIAVLEVKLIPWSGSTSVSEKLLCFWPEWVRAEEHTGILYRLKIWQDGLQRQGKLLTHPSCCP